MALSWNEIRKRSIEFSKEWENESREHAEAKSFWDDFFNVFGISRRRVATFEEPVKKLSTSQGFIDLFWKGQLIVEHKSRGKDLEKAYAQAIDYFPNLKEEELPKYILVSDFDRFRLYDLEERTHKEFHLSELHKNIKLFGFIAGYTTKAEIKEEDPVNIKAAELMGRLHDSLKQSGYDGHPLEVFLVRILFCLFADDTGIFERGIFVDYLMQKTKIDGSDVGPHLAQLFQILNTPEDKRYSSLDEDLQRFPYVNGKLYEEQLPFPSFDSSMRAALMSCALFDWGKISPAVFGSLFQSVMNPQERRNLGAHYTSEKNILKLIKPLFLDELWEEFEKVKSNKNKLVEFHDKLATLKFLDPACGCGNFLVITYRELRRLELEIIKILHKDQARMLTIEFASKINVDQMYGIEIEEWPARIAEVAMWLMDHQMNIELSEAIGQYYARLPLKAAANIVIGNALRIDWEDIVPKSRLSYILGNPPFIGKQYQTLDQKSDLSKIFKDIKGAGVLDYVSAWYLVAARYIQNTKIITAFVSTNSIAQGEQVGILWHEMFNTYGIKIHFAHRTFQWNNESRGTAAVHVVIIGFGTFDTEKKTIYEYESIKGDPHETLVKNINPYLTEGEDIVVLKRTHPIQKDIPEMSYGSMPNDGGWLLLNSEEMIKIVDEYPQAKKYIRPFVMGEELINGIEKWTIWLENIPPEEFRSIEPITERLNKVKELRMNSPREATRKLSEIPALFGERRQPSKNYLALPRVSSQNRTYIPMTFLSEQVICGDKVYTVPDANIFHIGILTSLMHMSWMKTTAGRMKSDYSYSNLLTYNNFPWPQDISIEQKRLIEEKAKAILDIRRQFPNSSLADLYDPLTMPATLLKAHKELDKAVDKAYRSKPFESEMERMEFLFEIYEQLISETNKHHD